MTRNVRRFLKAVQKMGNAYLEAVTGIDADGKPIVNPDVVKRVFADSDKHIKEIEKIRAKMELSDDDFDKALAKAGLPPMPRREDFVKKAMSRFGTADSSWERESWKV